MGTSNRRWQQPSVTAGTLSEPVVKERASLLAASWMALASSTVVGSVKLTTFGLDLLALAVESSSQSQFV